MNDWVTLEQAIPHVTFEPYYDNQDIMRVVAGHEELLEFLRLLLPSLHEGRIQPSGRDVLWYISKKTAVYNSTRLLLSRKAFEQFINGKLEIDDE